MSRLTRKFNVPAPTTQSVSVPAEVKAIESRINAAAETPSTPQQQNRSVEPANTRDEKVSHEIEIEHENNDVVASLPPVLNKRQKLMTECENLWSNNPSSLEYLRQSGISKNLSKYDEEGLEQLIALTKSVPKLRDLDKIASNLINLTAITDPKMFPNLSAILGDYIKVATFREMLLDFKVNILESIGDNSERSAFIKAISNAVVLDLNEITKS